jgi:hypothetical protein
VQVAMAMQFTRQVKGVPAAAHHDRDSHGCTWAQDRIARSRAA